MPTVSIVIPVFNAETMLGQLCAELAAELPDLSSDYEIVLVDDCSRDRSWEVIETLAKNDRRIRGIAFGRNFGQHNALLCGIRAARHEIIVTIDDDLQHPVAEIRVLLAKLAEGNDVVYGVPRVDQHGLFRNLASRMTKFALQGTIGVENARNVSAFRVFHSHLRGGFANFQSPSVSIDVLLAWATSRFASVTVNHLPRANGDSNYTLRMLVSHAFNLITGFSALPLKLASVAGFGLTVFGLLILAYVLMQYFVNGNNVPGFAFLASVITIFSGTQMFVMGIFGEYLARIHFRTLNRPPYFVREATGVDNDLQRTSDHNSASDS